MTVVGRLVRWLDRYIYVDKLRPARPGQTLLPRMGLRKWARYLLVLAVAGPVFAAAGEAVDAALVGLPMVPLLQAAAFVAGAVLLGVVQAVLLPQPEGNQTATNLLTVVLFTASAMAWLVYGPALLALLS